MVRRLGRPGADRFQPTARTIGRTGGRGWISLENDQSVLSATTVEITCSAGGKVTIYWGDGNSDPVTCDGTVQAKVHNYTATGQYTIRVVGTIWKILDFQCAFQTFISGPLAVVVGGIRDACCVALYGADISGDIVAVRRLSGLQELSLWEASVTGDVAAVSGMTSMQKLIVGKLPGLQGDVSAISKMPSLVYAYLRNTAISTYTSTPLPAWAGTGIYLQSLGLSTSDLNDFLIDLADGVGAGGTLNATGNGPRTAASNAAVAALGAAGWALTGV